MARGNQRLRIGDVIEVDTPKGYSYVHYTHDHPLFGSLVRVLPGLYQAPMTSDDVMPLLHQKERFFAFTPLGPPLESGCMRVVTRADVEVPFPLFRAAGSRDPESGSVANWFLWDGDVATPIGQLDADQRALPIREIVNDTLLVERIAEGWTPAAN